MRMLVNGEVNVKEVKGYFYAKRMPVFIKQNHQLHEVSNNNKT